MKVYRLEHSLLGVGPYHASDTMQTQLMNHFEVNGCECGEGMWENDECVCGPWTCEEIVEAGDVLNEAYSLRTNTPTPEKDGMSHYNPVLHKHHREMLFAFKSIDDLTDWFTADFLQYAFDRGFTIREFTLTDKSEILWGQSQLAFRNHESARMVHIDGSYLE